jgi:hypothetical protein
MPSGEIWRVDQDSALVRDLSFPIKDIDPGNLARCPAQLANGKLAFALLNTSVADYRGRGLYWVDLQRLAPQKVNGLPPAGSDNFNVDIFWSPDSVGALLHDKDNGAILYVPADGSPLYDLGPVMSEAYGFTWLEMLKTEP